MTTREEIEAAVDVVRRYNGVSESSLSIIADEFGLHHYKAVELIVNARTTLSDAYLAEHSRDNEPPTREMFEQLGARRMGIDEWCLCDSITWLDGYDRPWMKIPAFGNVAVDTIAKLRAACLLLGISTEGIL